MRSTRNRGMSSGFAAGKRAEKPLIGKWWRDGYVVFQWMTSSHDLSWGELSNSSNEQVSGVCRNSNGQVVEQTKSGVGWAGSKFTPELSIFSSANLPRRWVNFKSLIKNFIAHNLAIFISFSSSIMSIVFHVNKLCQCTSKHSRLVRAALVRLDRNHWRCFAHSRGRSQRPYSSCNPSSRRYRTQDDHIRLCVRFRRGRERN